MGQDSEEAAEFVATVRKDHVPMKTWYMGDSAVTRELQGKYGPYPALWKEVLNWKGWKESRKEFLRYQQQQQHQQDDNDGADPTNGDDGGLNDRKRKSRWGDAGNFASSSTHEQHRDEPDNSQAPRRRSRWGAGGGTGGTGGSHQDVVNFPGSGALPIATGMFPTTAMTTTTAIPLPGFPPGVGMVPAAPALALPGMPSNLTPQQQEEMQQYQARLRVVNDKLANIDQEAARVDSLPRGHRERSASPPPVYGPDGKRKNTRAVRWRERLTAERQDLLEKIMNLNPSTRRSGATQLLVRKRTKKIRIPVEDFPNYNFIGLIIGPRGKTQKELEAKTGCKIAIRGRGSVKEGARGRRDGKVMEGDHEPLHVVITGDDQRAVDAASDMIDQMLVVIDDEKNVHKQQQLRELAKLNGTLKDEEFCHICAEKGHRSFECPKRFALGNKQSSLQVKCAICGDTSHPTRDCTQKPATGIPGTAPPQNHELDSDYASFMAELEGKKSEKVEPEPASESANAPAASSGGGPPPLLPPPPPPLHGGLPPPPPPPPGGLPLLPPVAGMAHGKGLPSPPLATPLQPPGVMGHGYPSQHLQQHQLYTQGHGNNNNNNNYYGGVAGGNYQDPSLQSYQQVPYGVGTAGGGGNGSGGRGYYQQQQQQSQQQQQQQQQVKPGEETSGWDPSAYYGYGGADAGGFNWWES